MVVVRDVLVSDNRQTSKKQFYGCARGRKYVPCITGNTGNLGEPRIREFMNVRTLTPGFATFRDSRTEVHWWKRNTHRADDGCWRER